MDGRTKSDHDELKGMSHFGGQYDNRPCFGYKDASRAWRAHSGCDLICGSECGVHARSRKPLLGGSGSPTGRTRTGRRGAPIGAPPPFVFCRKVNAFVTFLCSTPSQRRAARRMFFSSPPAGKRRGKPRGRLVYPCFVILRWPPTGPASGEARAQYPRGGKGIYGRGKPGNCQNLPPDRFNFAFSLESNPGPIALGRT